MENRRVAGFGSSLIMVGQSQVRERWHRTSRTRTIIQRRNDEQRRPGCCAFQPIRDGCLPPTATLENPGPGLRHSIEFFASFKDRGLVRPFQRWPNHIRRRDQTRTSGRPCYAGPAYPGSRKSGVSQVCRDHLFGGGTMKKNSVKEHYEWLYGIGKLNFSPNASTAPMAASRLPSVIRKNGSPCESL